GEQVRELALSGRNYLELASLIPGAVQIDDDQMALTTSLGTGGTIINGSRGNTNSLMVDGGFNLDSGSNASQINNVGLNFIDQVKIQTSNFSAEYGRNSGAAINVVTKSGTINDPLTGQPFPGNIIPADRITTDGRAIANVYLAMIDRALQFADTPTANNATYQLDFPYKSREDIVRFDYRLNDANRVYLRF